MSNTSMDDLRKDLDAALRAEDPERFISTHEYYKNLIVANLQEHNLHQAAILTNEFASVVSNLKLTNTSFANCIYHLFPVNSPSVYNSLFLDADLADHLLAEKVDFSTCLKNVNDAHTLTRYVWQHKDSSLLEKLIRLWNEQKTVFSHGNNYGKVQTRINYCLKHANFLNSRHFSVSEEIDQLSAFAKDIDNESQVSSGNLLPLANANFKHFVAFMLRHGKFKAENNTKRNDILMAIEICIPSISKLDDALVYLWGTKGLLTFSESHMDQLFHKPQFEFDDLIDGVLSSREYLFEAFDASSAINILSQQMRYEHFQSPKYQEKLTRLIDAIITNTVEQRNAKRINKKGGHDIAMTAEMIMGNIKSNATDKIKVELLLNMSNHRKRLRLENDLSL